MGLAINNWTMWMNHPICGYLFNHHHYVNQGYQPLLIIGVIILIGAAIRGITIGT